MSTDKLEEITEEDIAKVSEKVKEKVQKPHKQKKYIYLVVFDPNLEEHFKIVPMQFEHLSYKHPLIKKTGAIFADEEYAKQFYNFVVTNAKKVDEERKKYEEAQKKAAAEQIKEQFEKEQSKRILDK